MSEEFVSESEMTNLADQNADTPNQGDSQGREGDALELLRKKAEHADNHIKQIEEENKDLREKMLTVLERLDKAAKVEDLLKEPSQPAQESPEATPATPSIDADAIASKVEAALTAKQVKQQQEANLAQAKKDLVGKYGKEVNDKVKEVAERNGVSVSDLMDMAGTRPQMFRNLFPELSQEAPKHSTNKGALNTAQYQGVPPKNEPTGYWQATTAKGQMEAVEKMFQRVLAQQ